MTEYWVFDRSETSAREAFSLTSEAEVVAVDFDPEALDPSSGIAGCGSLACSLPLLMKHDDEISDIRKHGTTNRSERKIKSSEL